jgi:hypothetical protein
LRKEERLADEVNRPSIAISELTYRAWRFALAGQVAGPQLTRSTACRAWWATSRRTSVSTKRGVSGSGGDATSTFREGAPVAVDVQGEERQVHEQRRTFDSPGAPESAPAYRDIPKEFMDNAGELLRPLVTARHLPPDEVATLAPPTRPTWSTSSATTNVDGFGYSHGVTSDWIPYRVHFTVTAEPGWYTRYHTFDAVVEVALDAKDFQHGCDPEPEIRVLTVMPAGGRADDRTTDRVAPGALAGAGAGRHVPGGRRQGGRRSRQPRRAPRRRSAVEQDVRRRLSGVQPRPDPLPARTRCRRRA